MFARDEHQRHLFRAEIHYFQLNKAHVALTNLIYWVPILQKICISHSIFDQSSLLRDEFRFRNVHVVLTNLIYWEHLKYFSCLDLFYSTNLNRSGRIKNN